MLIAIGILVFIAVILLIGRKWYKDEFKERVELEERRKRR